VDGDVRTGRDTTVRVETRDLVIVGAGFGGAATAWALAEAGATDVVLLERERTAGEHSSGRNAAIVRSRSEPALWNDLTQAGAAEIRREALAPFRRTGGILLGLGEREAKDVVPPARGRGLWCPDDGIADVAGLLAGFLRGRDLRPGCSVLGWRPDRDALLVETTRGPLRARTLVNAAGAWAGDVGGLALRPTNRTLYVTEPSRAVDASWPFVWDVPRGLYFRPESGGLMLCPCDERDAAPGDYAEEPGLLATLAARVAEQQPGLLASSGGDLRIAHRWVGQRTFSSDRLPAIGFDPKEPRLFHVAGLGGHGVTGSFPIGRLAASLLLGRHRGPNPYDPRRLLVPSARP
jgi:glycine/D-amino acid oxidase-like deaminating enzyme